MKTPHIPWTPLEEKVLAEALLDVFEDPIYGYDQNGPTFSLIVWESFISRMGKENYCSKDQTCSKIEEHKQKHIEVRWGAHKREALLAKWCKRYQHHINSS